MKSVLLSRKGREREELEAALEELDKDPKLLESVSEFIRFHTGTAPKHSQRSH